MPCGLHVIVYMSIVPKSGTGYKLYEVRRSNFLSPKKINLGAQKLFLRA